MEDQTKEAFYQRRNQTQVLCMTSGMDGNMMVEFEGIVDKETWAPVCVEGKRACPPEDWRWDWVDMRISAG